jgi:D-ribose pyranase
MLQDGRILNPRLLALLAGAGHTDIIVIADSGFPIAPGVEVVDLSLTPGVPSFLQTFDAVRDTLAVERMILAKETEGQPLYRELEPRLRAVVVERISHEEFKRLAARAKGVIRTGESTPYANIALVAAVTF